MPNFIMAKFKIIFHFDQFHVFTLIKCHENPFFYFLKVYFNLSENVNINTSFLIR